MNNKPFTSASTSADGLKKKTGFSVILSGLLKIFFMDALKVSIRRPSQAFYFLKTVFRQKKVARQRSVWKKKGFHVPPIAIFSVTNRCNLHCKGCFSWALHDTAGEEMSSEKLLALFHKAKELGIWFFVIGGGEPFVRHDILDITGQFPEIIFLIFTNGQLIDNSFLQRLKKRKNVIPVIGLEGREEETDDRRGKGVFHHLQEIIRKLKSNDIFFSVSITLTRNNFAVVTEEQFIEKMAGLGCKLFFFVEYSPVQEGTEHWELLDKQRDRVMTLMNSFRSKYKSLFIAVPGDEEEIGGCLSAGRGFIHISATGDIEPCPFAPYSDTNLRDSSLKQALQSDFLKTIRQNHNQLHEAEGGCALWVKREWVKSLLHSK